MAISRLSNIRQLLPGARQPEQDERLLQLFWNRAELKKELTRLQDERLKLLSRFAIRKQRLRGPRNTYRSSKSTWAILRSLYTHSSTSSCELYGVQQVRDSGASRSNSGSNRQIANSAAR